MVVKEQLYYSNKFKKIGYLRREPIYDSGEARMFFVPLIGNTMFLLNAQMYYREGEMFSEYKLLGKLGELVTS